MLALELLTEQMRVTLEGRGYPVGTVRRWKSGQWRKTPRGWEPVELPTAKAPTSTLKAPARTREFAKMATEIHEAMTAVPPPKAGPRLPTEKQVPVPLPVQVTIRKGMETLLKDFGLHSTTRTGTKAQTAKDESYRYDVMSDGPWAGAGLAPEGEGQWLNGQMDVGSHLMLISHATHAAATEFLKGGPPYDKKPPEAVRGFATLVHEQIHSAGGIRADEYEGSRVHWEEVTTELTARRVMRDTFGTMGLEHPLGNAHAGRGEQAEGFYDEQILSFKFGVLKAREKNNLPELDDAALFTYLTDAALATRRGGTGTEKLDAFRKRFAASLSVPEGTDKQAAAKYRQDAVESIDDELWYLENG